MFYPGLEAPARSTFGALDDTGVEATTTPHHACIQNFEKVHFLKVYGRRLK
jgi:hypothetical protein